MSYPTHHTVLLTLLYCLCFHTLKGQSYTNTCISKEDHKLIFLINEIRSKQDLPVLQYAQGLTYVAQTHLADLNLNHVPEGPCLPYSWYQVEGVTNCCIEASKPDWSCVISKPHELIDYPAKGFEVVLSLHEENMNAQEVIHQLKTSSQAMTMVLNQKNWSAIEWKSIGLSIGEKYAILWFSNYQETAQKIIICEESTSSIAP
ncbi:hypothetical protein [Algivirga pacifica]|uniref:Uncharacterized protein n=1 Tax=Algivirga pacifica TaxID=1162670 RepID=A0ABP9DCY3_9BACT